MNNEHYPINQRETSCSSPAITAAPPHLQPCADTNIVSVSMEPRLCSYRGAPFPDRYCLHSSRQASRGRNGRPWMCWPVKPGRELRGVFLCVSQELLTLSWSLKWGGSLIYYTVTPVSFSIHWLLIAPEKNPAETSMISAVNAWCLCGEQIGTVLDWTNWAIKCIKNWR